MNQQSTSQVLDGPVPDKRGRPGKYNFEDFELHEIREFKKVTVSNLHSCAKSWSLRRGLGWQFRCWKEKEKTFLQRIQ